MVSLRNRAFISLFIAITIILVDTLSFNITSSEAENSTHKASLIKPPEHHIVVVHTPKKPSLINSKHFLHLIQENESMTVKEKMEFVVALKKAKLMFPKVPTSLIFSTIRTESDMDPRAKHPNKSDHGLCGVNFKYNGEDLINAGIITKESDLNKIAPNILACAFLYNRFLTRSHGKVRLAIFLYKGTNAGNRCDSLYSLYRSTVFLVYKG